jgi:nicotinamidase-related amidase
VQLLGKPKIYGLVLTLEFKTDELRARRIVALYVTVDGIAQRDEANMKFFRARHTALIIVDVQKAFDEWEGAGKRRNNPSAVSCIKTLLADFRAKRASIIHIRHAALDPVSRFQHNLPGFMVKDEAREQSDEPVIVKHVNSAFIGTDLETRLRRDNIETVVIVGATTNHCVDTTARMAANLGFEAKVVRDATWAFECDGVDGEHFTADQVHAMTLANLQGEFAEIVTASDVMSRLVQR